MACETCAEFQKWIDRLTDTSAPLSQGEQLDLREFLKRELDSHVDAAGEASWVN